MSPPENDIGKLKAACDHAYTANLSSCSNAVWDVIKAILNPSEPFRDANGLIDYMKVNWKEVTVGDGYDLANKGVVVVGGLQVLGGHGHVIVIYPGAKKPAGGYTYWWKRGNKYILLPPKGSFPRALSTSIGARSSLDWPGTLSCGDKTVWDPWGDDAKFKEVKFWTPKV